MLSVIMQGPIGLNTYEFAELYAQFDCVDEVIISTWIGSDDLAFNSSKITQIKSNLPQNAGMGNRNCQIVSSRAGIDHIKKYAGHVLKVRTDMFLPCLPEMYAFYHKMRQGPEIFTLSVYPRFPFHPRDHVFLGSCYYMQQLFDIPLDNVSKPVYDEFTDIRSESYIGLPFYYKSDGRYSSEIAAFVKNPELYLPDNAPHRREALKIYHEMIISRKGFVPFPKVEICWPRRYPHGYPFEYLQKLYGETYHDNLMEFLHGR